MRKIAGVILFLCALFSLSGLLLQAQSGRRPVAPSTNGTSANSTNQTSSDSETNETSTGVINVPISGNGETVEGDVIRVDTSLVTVPVSVMDRDGKYIPNLKRGDFHIFEDGVEQRIAYFGTVDQPFTVALLIDTSRSTHFKMSEIQDAAIAFVNQLKPADRVMVISFDDHINVLTDATNDRDALTRAIRRTETGGSTRLYDAVEQVMTKYMKSISGRKAVVLFTDGVDTASKNGTYEKTVREAEESDMVFYPVSYNTRDDMVGGNGRGQWPSRRGRGGMGGGFPNWPGGGGRGGGWPGGGRGRGGRGGGSSREDYERADQYLHDLAQKSGGRFYGGDTLQDISQAFAQVAEELRRQYSLGYYPKSSGQAGDRRQIKVRVNQPDLVVTSRDSYVYSAKKTAPTQSNDPQQAKPTSQENHLDEKR